jgi:RNA polymerase sigma factor (sigma-70 family)
MDVQARAVEDNPSDDARGPTALAPLFGTRRLAAERTGQLLGEYKASELRLARNFPECRNMSKEELEDLYQETALALLDRRFQREEHLRNALREGIKHRALNLHRDERRRQEILDQTGARSHVMAQIDEDAYSPEHVALAHQDRAIVSEFLTELTQLEQRVFWLHAEGMQYRAIAPVLGIATTEARNASRACERKRQRFQLLYDTGRLCGYRATTIQALQSGETRSEELAQRAFAHLDACPSCRAEHKTNAMRLRRSFRDQAAALLPVPALAGHLGWLTKLAIRTRALQHRLTDGSPLGQGAVRERAAALLAGGGGAKLAAGAITIAVIAGGTIGATHALHDHPQAHHPHTRAPSPVAAPSPSPPPAARAVDLVQGPTAALTGARTPKHSLRTPARRTTASRRHALPSHRRAAPLELSTRREPGGFAYLGVPTDTTSTPRVSEAAHTATRSAGGPFSP